MEWIFAATLAVLAVAATAVLIRSIAARQAAQAHAALSAELAAARALAADGQRRLEALQAELAHGREQAASLRAEHAALSQDNRWLREEVARHTQALGSTQDLLDKADQRLRDTFQSLAVQALNDNRSSFFDLARTSFEGYHQPIAETLKRVDARLGEAERDRVAAYSRLAEQVAALGSTASMLSRALRMPAVRGRWGEMQLRRVVEISGMLQRCDFDEQPGLQSENGRLRPDLIVQLPGGKQIVVDAKAPLEAFLDAQEAADDEVRLARLQAHARQVRDHMDTLASRAYWEQLGSSPEMVVMFLPGETLFSAALQHDLTLIEYGLQQKVLLASPITLIALLTTVAHTWRQEALTDNYREVARLGKELYDRLAALYGHFDELRKRLDGAVQAYNKAAGSFESRVLVTARRFKELDVTTADDLLPLEPVETAPRVLKQAGLMGLPDDAMVDPDPELT
jgi:DNA recombination protein RmuC